MMRPVLVLEHDSNYADKKGKEYYLNYFTTASTKYHDALPDILKSYDAVTGLWPESPGYALGTIEKRRLVSIIRTSDSTGYYVDIFRSDLDNNDYLWHNLGNQMLLADLLNMAVVKVC